MTYLVYCRKNPKTYGSRASKQINLSWARQSRKRHDRTMLRRKFNGKYYYGLRGIDERKSKGDARHLAQSYHRMGANARVVKITHKRHGGR